MLLKFKWVQMAYADLKHRRYYNIGSLWNLMILSIIWDFSEMLCWHGAPWTGAFDPEAGRYKEPGRKKTAVAMQNNMLMANVFFWGIFLHTNVLGWFRHIHSLPNPCFTTCTA